MQNLKNMWNGTVLIVKGAGGYITLGFYNPSSDVQKLQAKIAALQKQMQKIKSPEEIAAAIQRMKQSIWESYRQMKFPKCYQGKINIIFVGKTSVGKSSLLNELFKPKQKLKVSKGMCTTQISIVAQIGKVRIFDCPGFETQFDIVKKPGALPKYLGKMDIIYYLYENPEKDIIQACLSMNKELYFVRTKCDPDEIPEENQQLKVKDEKLIGQIGVEKPEIFFTSKYSKGEDNKKLFDHIMKH